jgi:hypothetical protein
MRWGRRALREPVALGGAIMGAVNTAAVMGLLNLTDHQVEVLNVAMGSVLVFFARTLVTPLARPRGRHGRALVHATQPAGPEPGPAGGARTPPNGLAQEIGYSNLSASAGATRAAARAGM